VVSAVPADRPVPWRPVSIHDGPPPRRHGGNNAPILPPPREPRDYGPASAAVAAIVARSRNLRVADIEALDLADLPPSERDRRWSEIDRHAPRWPASHWVNIARRDASAAVWEAMRRRELPRPDRSGRARWQSAEGPGYGAARQAALAAAALAIRERLGETAFETLTATWATIVGLPPDVGR
jgi:hypothetical protein